MNAFEIFLHLLFIYYLELTTEIFVFLAIWQTFLLSVVAIIICFPSFFLELIQMSSLGQQRRNHFLFCWENKYPDTSMNFTVKSRHLSFLFQFSQIKKETSYFDHYFIFPKQNSKFSRIFWNQLIYYFDWKKSFAFQPIPTCLLKFHIKLSSKYNGYMTNVACSHWEHAQCINTRTPTLAI